MEICENGLTLQCGHLQTNDAMELYRQHPHMPGLRQIRENDFVSSNSSWKLSGKWIAFHRSKHGMYCLDIRAVLSSLTV